MSFFYRLAAAAGPALMTFPEATRSLVLPTKQLSWPGLRLLEEDIK